MQIPRYCRVSVPGKIIKVQLLNRQTYKTHLQTSAWTKPIHTGKSRKGYPVLSLIAAT
jgi:hypothetical protein